MAFIKLTRLEDRFVYINSNLIESIVSTSNGENRIFMTGGDDTNYWIVNQTPEEIIELIKQANNG